MRGQTASGGEEKLEFGHQARPGYGYRLTEFVLYPSTGIGSQSSELCGTITSGTTAVAPTDPNFNDAGLIATFVVDHNSGSNYGPEYLGVINDLFVITQDLILMVQDTGGSSLPVNWHCRFEEIKLSGSAEAVANYKQFTIYNTSMS